MDIQKVIAEANYDEAKVGPYTLPDPLTCLDGIAVKAPEQWRRNRRPEVLRLFEEHMYGRMFPPLPIAAQVVEESDKALQGEATRRQVEITFPGHPASSGSGPT